MGLQAAVHLLQTEGSKMVLALCESSYNQGVYGLVTNLGSLVVRTIFFPVEEAAFRAFSSPSGELSCASLQVSYHAQGFSPLHTSRGV